MVKLNGAHLNLSNQTFRVELMTLVKFILQDWILTTSPQPTSWRPRQILKRPDSRPCRGHEKLYGQTEREAGTEKDWERLSPPWLATLVSTLLGPPAVVLLAFIFRPYSLNKCLKGVLVLFFKNRSEKVNILFVCLRWVSYGYVALFNFSTFLPVTHFYQLSVLPCIGLLAFLFLKPLHFLCF